MIPIVVQIEIQGLILVLSISGGKDSTAVALALREAGIPFRMVFADTGWEARETYDHLDYLRTVLGPIDVVAAPGGMVEKIRKRAGFPARMQRWCTRELKLDVLRKYHDAIEAVEGETVCVVGVRAGESDARAKMAVLEDEPVGDRSWGGWVWRPILSWNVEDVIRIHNRHGVRMNPLYHRGHDRVGCYPCIFARKEEIRLIAEHCPERIDEIRTLESECTEERQRRNAAEPGRYQYPIGTFFQGRGRGEEARNGSMAIDNVVSWSKTVRGGKQFPLLAPVPEGGCMRWGLCETHGEED
jgi:3'-phosphoadenosine 5'-phosphosulfate sulfotransferase (PAPS reductase)/FAD synthetase